MKSPWLRVFVLSGACAVLLLGVIPGGKNDKVTLDLVASQQWSTQFLAATPAVCNIARGDCDVKATQPAPEGPEGQPNNRKPGVVAPQKDCTFKGKEIPCTNASLPGSWWNRWDECYYTPRDISDPDWARVLDQTRSYFDMVCLNGGPVHFRLGSSGYVVGFTSFKNPEESNPPADHPYGLAITASKRMKFPQPQVEFLRHAEYINNNPLVLVNAPMWWWATDAAQWKPMEQTARAGEVWARLSATPQGWTFNPGNGDSEVSCNGPGEQWKPGGGFWAKSPTGCSYTYKYTSIDQQDQKMTGTFSRTWRLNWVASDGTSGTLPVMHTSVTHRFRVGEAQTLVTQ